MSSALTPAVLHENVALKNAITLWASSSTAAASPRSADLVRDKRRAVEAFFSFCHKHPAEVQPLDVKKWQEKLAERLRPNSIYVRVSFLSSFYEWARRDAQLGRFITSNPVLLARPRAPRAYQTESTKALTDKELTALLAHVKAKADAGELVGKRDYALLLLFVATGMRRAEILSLRGRDVKFDEAGEGLVLTSRVKGGSYAGREVADPLVREALRDYLAAAGRSGVLKTDAPLWTRHDRAGRAGAPLTGHCFARNMKRYARAAGMDGFHLHQTRHTYARIVAEETGSITETQDALGHKNLATTKVYVQRIAVKRDRHSGRVLSRVVGTK